MCDLFDANCFSDRNSALSSGARDSFCLTNHLLSFTFIFFFVSSFSILLLLLFLLLLFATYAYEIYNAYTFIIWCLHIIVHIGTLKLITLFFSLSFFSCIFLFSFTLNNVIVVHFFLSLALLRYQFTLSFVCFCFPFIG